MATPLNITTADGRSTQLDKWVTLRLDIKGTFIDWKFVVYPCNEIIIGWDFGEKYDLTLASRSRKGTIKHKGKIIDLYLSRVHYYWPGTVEQAGKSLYKIQLPQLNMDQLEKEAHEYHLKDDIEFLLTRNTRIPAMAEVRVPVIGSSANDTGEDYFITNPSVSAGTIIRHQLDSSSCKGIYVTNFNRFPVKLLAGQVVARGHPLHSLTNFTIKVKDNKITGSEPAGETVYNNQEFDISSYFAHNYNSLVAKDLFRLLEKNKQAGNYPTVFDGRDPACKQLMKQELEEKTPSFVLEKNEVHPNLSRKVTFETFDFSCFNIGRHGMFDTQITAMKKLIFEYRDMFVYSKRDMKDLDRSKLPKVDIRLSDPTPVKVANWRRSPMDRKIIEELVQEQLDYGIIEPTNSDFASPVVIVTKKDGSKRFCVDYRKLNQKTIKEIHPLPLISDALDSCAGSKFFTSLDLFSGYHHLPMADEAKPLTAFTTHLGNFQYKVLPFGLTNGPSKFQKMVDRVLGNLKWTSCFVYLDDTIVFGPDFKTHQERLEKVLNCFRDVKLMLNPKKCSFGFKELEYLGFLVSEGGVRPSESKMDKLRSIKEPVNKKQLQSFLGLVNYFRSFVKDFAKICKPLYGLLKAEQKFIFTPACSKAFEEIKEKLVSRPVRTFFREDCRHEVHTDGSGLGLGGVLLQEEENEAGEPVMKVVQYWARGLKPAEQNYAATELELLAAVEACEAFRPYIHGLPFEMVTDHVALTSSRLCDGKRGNRRIQKWVLLLSEFDITEWRYKKGKMHVVPDFLSRMAQDAQEGIEPDEDRMFFNRLCTINSEVQEAAGKQSLKELQELDPYCTNIKEKIRGQETNARRKKKMFQEKDGLLYRKWMTRTGETFCVVLPDQLVKSVIKQFHDGDTGVHPGQNRTIQAIRDKYWWPRLKSDIINYVRQCDHCARKKPVRWAKPASKPTCDSFAKNNIRPFAWLCIDLIDLREHGTFHKNKYIVTVSDYLTKYVIVGGIKSLTADDLAGFFFENITMKVSSPAVLISDNGSNFRSQEFKNFCKRSRIEHRFIAPYRAQSNGQVERMNGIIKEALSSFVGRNHRDWDNYLQVAAYGINCLTSTTTGMSPFEAVFGYRPRNVFDNKLNIPDLSFPDGQPDSRIDLWKNLWKKVEKRGEKLKQRKVRKYLPKYEVGEKVLILDHSFRPGRVKGFLHNFKGPYIVVDKLIQDTYKVSRIDNLEEKQTVHTSEMKRYYVGDPIGISYDFSDGTAGNEEGIMDEEEILIPIERYQAEEEDNLIPQALFNEEQEGESEPPQLARKDEKKKKKPAVPTHHPMVTRSRSKETMGQ